MFKCIHYYQTDQRQLKTGIQPFTEYEVKKASELHESCVIAQHGDTSLPIRPPLAPPDWSLPVSIGGRGARLISICLYVNESQIAFSCVAVSS